ncbi:hypothetical protein K440DRAFT_636099 [Wilcoxina mikolae CBS 423.85]|nr:hypothetical protein K440DRAFT_636099 [Wilcoxina mikolae CBS 423.85]
MSYDINDFQGGYPGQASSNYGSDWRSGDDILGPQLLSPSDNETGPPESDRFDGTHPAVSSYVPRRPFLETNRSIPLDLRIEIQSANVTRKLESGSRELKKASVIFERKIRAHERGPPVPLLIQVETDEATEALVWAIRIANNRPPGPNDLQYMQYAQFVDLVHVVWQYKFIIRDKLQDIAESIKGTYWRSPGDISWNPSIVSSPTSSRSSPTGPLNNPTPSTTCYEAWMLLASLFKWEDVFREASREVILDNDCGKSYPAPGHGRLPQVLQDDVLRNRQDMKAIIKEFADTLTIGKGLQASNAVCRATFEIRNGLNKHGINLTLKCAHSPAQLLRILNHLLDDRFRTSLGDPELPPDVSSHAPQRRGSAASNHRQPGVGREGQLVTAIEGRILRIVKEKLSNDRRKVELEVNISAAELKELDRVYDSFRTKFGELKSRLHGLDLHDYHDLWRNHLGSNV